MDERILNALYANPTYLDYLRHHPKWYPYLEQDPNNFTIFENALKKELKLTTYDRLENMKKQINFVSAMLNYFEK